MQKFAQAGIVMNCPDRFLPRPERWAGPGKRAWRSWRRCIPEVKSVSIVPVGLTRYREGLYPLRPYHQDEARNVVAQVEAFGDRCVERLGSRMFWCSDEFYLQAGLRPSCRMHFMRSTPSWKTAWGCSACWPWSCTGAGPWARRRTFPWSRFPSPPAWRRRPSCEKSLTERPQNVILN